MSLFDLISQEQLDDLDEDTDIAFADLVNLAQRKLDAETKGLNPDNEYEWQQIELLRHSFVNVVVAAGKHFEINPFFSMDVPRVTDFSKNDYIQFKSDVEHYITQLMLSNRHKRRTDSVQISAKGKDDIRSYIHGLRSCIEKASIDEKKRESLLSRLEALEHELEKRRTDLKTVARLAFYFLGLPGSIWGSVDIVHKLVSNIIVAAGEAKITEDETRHLSPAIPPKTLIPARKQLTQAEAPAKHRRQLSETLDDDIPF